MRKGVTLLLSTLLAMTSIAAVSPSAFAEDGRIWMVIRWEERLSMRSMHFTARQEKNGPVSKQHLLSLTHTIT